MKNLNHRAASLRISLPLLALLAAVAGAGASQPRGTDSGTKKAQHFTPKQRSAALLVPCKNITDPACRLSRLFGKDDPAGDKFLRRSFVAAVFLSEKDLPMIDNWHAVFEMIEAWIPFLQRRNTYLVMVLYDAASKADYKNVSSDELHLYNRGRVRPFFIDELRYNPESVFISILKNIYGDPVLTKVEAQTGSTIAQEWEARMAELLRRRAVPAGGLRFLVVTKIKTEESQRYHRLLELGALTAPHGGVVSEGGSGLQPHAAVPGFHAYDLRRSSGCSLADVPGSCRFLRSLPDEALVGASDEAVACGFLLTRPDGGVGRKVVVGEEFSDEQLLAGVLDLCPAVLVIHKARAPAASDAAVDAVLEEHADQLLVAVVVAGRKAKVPGALNTTEPAVLLSRQRHQAPVRRRGVGCGSEEALRHAVRDLMALHRYQQSVRPELRYLNLRRASDEFGMLETEPLTFELRRFFESANTSRKFPQMTERFFAKARQRPFFLVHFFQPWSLRGRAGNVIVMEARQLLRERHGLPSAPVSALNCFRLNDVCRAEGVATYSTFTAFRRGVAQRLTGTASVANVVRLVLASTRPAVQEARTAAEMARLGEEYADLVDCIFVGVGLTQAQQDEFSRVAATATGEEVFVRTAASCLPAGLRGHVTAKPALIAFHPRFPAPFAVEEDPAGPECFDNFVRAVRLGRLAELRWDDRPSLEAGARPLLVLFTRRLTAGLKQMMAGVAARVRGAVCLRWMNASETAALAVMEAYGLSSTPALALKTAQKVFNFPGSSPSADAVGAWISDVTDGKLPADYNLPQRHFTPFGQVVDAKYEMYPRAPLSGGAKGASGPEDLPVIRDEL